MNRKVVPSLTVLAFAVLIIAGIITFGFPNAKAATINSSLSASCRTECISGYRETSWDDGYYVHPHSYCHVYCPGEDY